ncbi:MAG: glycoside hydrolase family 32 protein [Bryobacteraceae bacterium]|nr:glycoside hydrolase family 32 protein [Bryobacteraceae bacterium]
MLRLRSYIGPVSVLAAALLCVALEAADPHRPAFHFQPPANWMNDTMGIFWKGEYHIFYLYNPDGPVWRQAKEWGHASSKDLIHWKHLPAALGPVPGGPENLCCQTGSVTIANGVPTAVYTCAPGICMATSDDQMITWRRSANNPVIPDAPPGLDVYGFRDPFLYHGETSWYLLQGSGIKGQGGRIFVYKSDDLNKWEFLHPLLPEEGKTDQVWEVPGLFRIGNQDLLMYSPTKESLYTRYFLGSFQNEQFIPTSRGKMDFGGYFYAATTFADDQRRRLMIAWTREGRSKEAVLKAGWSGALSAPRQLSLNPQGQLLIEPVAELNRLHGKHKTYSNLRLTAGEAKLLDFRGDTLDIVAEFDPGDAKRIGLKVRSSANGEEETLVYIDRASGEFVFDSTRSSKSSATDKKKLSDAFSVKDGKTVKLRVLVDRSIIEAFVDSRVAVSGRAYPELPESLGVRVFAEGGSAIVRKLDIWEMKPVW